MLERIPENFLIKIKLWHILASILFVVVLCVSITATIMLGIPKYVDYLDDLEMRQTIKWAETHSRAAMTIGPWLQKYPEYSEYMLYQKVDDDLDEINVKK